MSELFYILLPFVILYLFKLYPLFRKDLVYLLFVFWVTGVATLAREFTYIKFGFIYITEFIMLSVILSSMVRASLGRKLITFKSGIINVALLFLFAYQSWGLLRLIYDLLFFKPSVTSEDNILTVLRNFSLVYYSVFVYIVLIVLNFEGTKKIEVIFKSILYFSVLRNIVIIILYAIGYETFIPEDGGIIGGHHSLIAVFSFLISFYFLIEYRDLKYLFFLLLNLIFVVLSSHRSAFMALIGSVLLLILLYKGQIKFKLITALLISFFGLSFVIITFFESAFALIVRKISENFESLVYYKLSDPNANWRYLYWNNVLKVFLENPIGVGFNYSLSNLAPWWVWSDNPREILFRSSLRLDPHNSFLSILVRTGAVGFAMFTLFLAIFFIIVRKTYKKAKGKIKNLLIISFSNFTSVSIFAMFNVTLEGPYHGTFFWIWIGICLFIALNVKNAVESNGIFKD